ncbi:MAG: TatD family hydrolase [Clostridia bacterium]|nr:TatD family hydrolase [Clostridia bacterium]
MALLFDSHAHYFDARFHSEECPSGVDSLLDSLFATCELGGIVNVGTDIGTSLAAIAQAKRYPLMYAAVGIHPSDAQRYPDMGAELGKLELLLQAPRENKIVALGEIGLDYHYPETDKKMQAEYLDAQLSLAVKYQMPVIIHDREAHGDCFDAICRHPGVFGVFHSYSGSAEMAQDLIRRGFCISFSGTITFKNATKIAAVAASLPQDRVLIETDCPYLAPHPFRGHLNHSGLVRHTAEKLAELWGVSYEEAVAITSQNAKRLFRLWEGI